MGTGVLAVKTERNMNSISVALYATLLRRCG